jgi:hypothetical protein
MRSDRTPCVPIGDYACGVGGSQGKYTRKCRVWVEMKFRSVDTSFCFFWRPFSGLFNMSSRCAIIRGYLSTCLGLVSGRPVRPQYCSMSSSCQSLFGLEDESNPGRCASETAAPWAHFRRRRGTTVQPSDPVTRLADHEGRMQSECCGACGARSAGDRPTICLACDSQRHP